MTGDTTDGLGAYVSAIENVFGADVDFGQVVKIYSQPGEQEQRRYSPPQCKAVKRVAVSGEPEDAFISTSYVEQQKLNMRMSLRPSTRLTNAFSKRLRNHLHVLSLYFVWHNYCRRHGTLRTTAAAAGLADDWRDAEWIVSLIDARTPAPSPRGPYGPRKLQSDTPPIRECRTTRASILGGFPMAKRSWLQIAAESSPSCISPPRSRARVPIPDWQATPTLQGRVSPQPHRPDRYPLEAVPAVRRRERSAQ